MTGSLALEYIICSSHIVTCHVDPHHLLNLFLFWTNIPLKPHIITSEIFQNLIGPTWEWFWPNAMVGHTWLVCHNPLQVILSILTYYNYSYFETQYIWNHTTIHYNYFSITNLRKMLFHLAHWLWDTGFFHHIPLHFILSNLIPNNFQLLLFLNTICLQSRNIPSK